MILRLKGLPPFIHWFLNYEVSFSKETVYLKFWRPYQTAGGIQLYYRGGHRLR